MLTQKELKELLSGFFALGLIVGFFAGLIVATILSGA
jgi:hypothetical protein